MNNVKSRFEQLRKLQFQLKEAKRGIENQAAVAITNLGPNIREAREKMGLTQQELCESLGVTRGQVANIELGNSSVTLPVFTQICITLGTSPNELLGFENETASGGKR